MPSALEQRVDALQKTMAALIAGLAATASALTEADPLGRLAVTAALQRVGGAYEDEGRVVEAGLVFSLADTIGRSPPAPPPGPRQ